MSATLLSGLSIGVVYLAVVIPASVTVFFSRNFIPPAWKPVYLLLITSAWVTIVDMLLQAWFFPLRGQLGIYVFILAMNTALLHHLEESPLRERFVKSGLDSLKTGLLAVALLAVTGLLREIIARGGILTDIDLLSRVHPFDSLQPLYLFSPGLNLFDTTAGALILFGLLLAVPGCCRLVFSEK